MKKVTVRKVQQKITSKALGMPIAALILKSYDKHRYDNHLQILAESL